jgi:hypothetical protein
MRISELCREISGISIRLRQLAGRVTPPAVLAPVAAGAALEWEVAFATGGQRTEPPYPSAVSATYLWKQKPKQFKPGRG